VQMTVKQFGTLVVLSTFDFAEHPDKPLNTDADFTAALAQVSQDPIATVYLNGVNLTKQVDAMVQLAPNPQAAAMWPKIRDALGLPGLKKMIVTDAFQGKDWATQAFIDAPAPRTGLASLLDSQLLSDDILKAIPDTSTMAAAGQFDLAKFVDTVRSVTAQIDPDTGQMLDGWITQADSMVGFDLRTDLLGAFGDEWASYSDPDVAGRGTMGVVVINKCRDPQKLASSLSSLEKIANQMIASFTAQASPLLTVTFRTETIDGLEVHYADIPVIMPSWTIKDGIWYLGMYPQVVVSAAERPAGKSILDNPHYQDLMQRLGSPTQIGGMEFVDVPVLADQGYQGVMLLTSIFVGGGDLAGLHAPPMVLPTLRDIKPELEPIGGVTWVDDAGWHAKSVCAFPGDAMLAVDQNGASLLLQCVSTIGTLVAQQRTIAIPSPQEIPLPPPSPSPGL
jgi:hypothetical protein